MIRTIFKFLGGNKWLLIGGAAIASASAAGAWHVQNLRYGLQIAEIENTQWQTEIQRQQQLVEAHRYQNQVKDLVSQNRALAEQKQKTVTEYVTKEVTKYVQSPDAGQCHFTDDWVRPYDSAAAGLPQTDTTTGSDADAPRITDIEVLENATGNYATCHDIRQDLISLQEWVRRTYESNP
jgi:hypothetical protein